MHSLVRAAVAAVFGMAAFAPALAQSIAAGDANTGGDDSSPTAAKGSEGGAMDTLIVLGTAQKDTTALTTVHAELIQSAVPTGPLSGDLALCLID
jgi:hypothetical protein